MKQAFLSVITSAFVLFSGCSRPDALTAKSAEAIIRSQVFMVAPEYAEVPRVVSFGPAAPKDDFDEKAIRTLRNLETAGLITIEASRSENGTERWEAKATERGFPILGTVPSARGPAYRARICEKRFSAVRNFRRHPTDPLVGRAEIVWQYENPTPFYPVFETKLNKPIGVDFVSVASIFWDKGWKVQIIVKKDEATRDGSAAAGN